MADRPAGFVMISSPRIDRVLTWVMGLLVLVHLIGLSPCPAEGADTALEDFLRSNLSPANRQAPYRVGLWISRPSLRRRIRNLNLNPSEYRFYSFLESERIGDLDPATLSGLARDRNLSHFLVWKESRSILMLYDPRRRLVLDEVTIPSSENEEPTPELRTEARPSRRVAQPRTGMEPTLSMEGTVLDFDLTRVGSATLLGWIRTEGFSLARWSDGELAARRSHNLPPGAMNLSLIREPGSPTRTIYVLISFFHTRKQQIWTILYEYDLVKRTMKDLWVANDAWMRRIGSRSYGVSLRRYAEHFRTIRPVRLNPDDWSYLEPTLAPSDQTLLSAFLPVPGTRQYLRIGAEGSLEWFAGANRVSRYDEEIGHNPLKVFIPLGPTDRAAQQARQRSQERKQGLALIPGSGGRRGVAAVRNFKSTSQQQAWFSSGVYDRCQILAFEMDHRRLQPIYRSNVLEGYYSQIRWFDGSLWGMRVEPGLSRSHLHRLPRSLLR